MERCSWCGSDPAYIAYHDTEWGVPERDPVRLFEGLVLESFQSGLSWRTILAKRENFCLAFAGFDPVRIAAFDDGDIDRLLSDAGIVRHRGKIEATIANARAWIEIEGQDGFTDFVWDVVDGVPLQPHRQGGDVPAVTPEATTLAKRLKGRGVRFFGPTTAYAFMQAKGLVNDHVAGCFRHAPLSGGSSGGAGAA